MKNRSPAIKSPKMSRPHYATIGSTKGVAGKLPKPISWKRLKEVAVEDSLLEYYGKNSRIISASEARNHFGEVIQRAYANDEDQIVTRSGLPVAAIISIKKYLLLYPERAQQLTRAESRK